MGFFDWLSGKEKPQEEEIEKYPEKATTLSVLDGFDEPWQIRKGYWEKKRFEIWVFNLKDSKWHNLSYCAQEIIGVRQDEYSRLISEKFGASGRDSSNPTFETIEEAQKAIDEFKPYYDSYHTARAIIERLSFYDEGSYPPYFSHHVKEEYFRKDEDNES